jgi:hypothetical protein
MSLFPFSRDRFILLSRSAIALATLVSCSGPIFGQTVVTPPAPPTPPAATAMPMEEVVVYGRENNLIGEAEAASQGQIGAAELQARPFLRRGELLEVVPGVVITQHSGSGKANQYFLRGFNLDHGTDFAISVDGLPVNLRTHAHGQGYSDLNFIIPELVQSVSYQKGAYSAENGDFSAAGAAQFNLVTSLPRSFAKVEFGDYDYLRAVVAGTVRERGGATTLGLEAFYDNGPWDLAENARRLNGFARHTWTAGAGEASLTLLGYHGEWRSSDQIPERAIASGAVSPFGAIDPTDGGDSDRASLSFDWHREQADTSLRLNLYALYYRLNLFSNFTYFLDDPVHGDQFAQHDRRGVFGGSFEYQANRQVDGRKATFTFGLQTRADTIDLALDHTESRQLLGVVRADTVKEASVGTYVKEEVAFTDWFRATAGVRADAYRFDVASDTPANSGIRSAGLASPKLSLTFGPWDKTELYVSGGYGFHSNDARGVTTHVDPADGVTAVTPASPLVRARNVEVGVRTAAAHGLVSTVSLWMLDLDSELVFAGDAGATEASGPTRRYGVELANFYRPVSWLAVDGDLAFTHARFRDDAGDAPNVGRRIPNSIATTLTGGVVADLPHGWKLALRGRYFGPQPLIEDNSVIGPSSLTFNARLGWHNQDWEIALDVLNLFDRASNDIAYDYESQLRGEPAPVDDIHLHPAEPRQFRLGVTRRF